MKESLLPVVVICFSSFCERGSEGSLPSQYKLSVQNFATESRALRCFRLGSWLIAHWPSSKVVSQKMRSSSAFLSCQKCWMISGFVLPFKMTFDCGSLYVNFTQCLLSLTFRIWTLTLTSLPWALDSSAAAAFSSALDSSLLPPRVVLNCRRSVEPLILGPTLHLLSK